MISLAAPWCELDGCERLMGGCERDCVNGGGTRWRAVVAAAGGKLPSCQLPSRGLMGPEIQ
jgi:MoaA/NifB/PqqE/SkfB family radical SAM enzyme